jgi:uracil-DNA glycosylase
MFTGDGSGDFLYPALHRAGLASQVSSRDREDGMQLFDAYITAVARCAPPGNRPLPGEIRKCRPYLLREFKILKNVDTILTLGRIAFDGTLEALMEAGHLSSRSGKDFRHGASYPIHKGLTLAASYHPSRQNTQTGRLTRDMFDRVLNRILLNWNRGGLG